MTESLALTRVSLPGREGPRLEVDSLALDAARMTALVGPNGSGKTSLLRAILGLEPTLRGQICHGDTALGSLSPHARAARIGWLPQHEQLQPSVMVEEYLVAACARFSWPRREAVARAREALHAQGLGALWNSEIVHLSGGERQRLSLVALSLQRSAWWLCDEPANHLDPARQFEIYRHLGDAWRKGQALVCVTHDINLLWYAVPPEDWSRVRVLGMREGHVAFDCPLSDSALPASLGALYGLQVAKTSDGTHPRLMMRPHEVQA